MLDPALFVVASGWSLSRIRVASCSLRRWFQVHVSPDVCSIDHETRSGERRDDVGGLGGTDYARAAAE